MPRISALPSLTTADNADELPIVDVSASVTKKITRGDLLKAPLPTNSVTTTAIANTSVTASKLDFTTLSFGNYSTTEVDTGFKWVDGRAIYKKTISMGTGPNNTSKTVAHGITGLRNVISLEGMAGDITTPTYRNYPASISSSTGSVTIIGKMIVLNANIEWYASYNATPETGYCTLLYTKT